MGASLFLIVAFVSLIVGVLLFFLFQRGVLLRKRSEGAGNKSDSVEPVRFCPACGASNPHSNLFCEQCGAELGK